MRKHAITAKHLMRCGKSCRLEMIVRHSGSSHIRENRKRRSVRAGRALLHELAGSYVIGSVARCVFVMQFANDDPEESRIVWICCKNNDGELGPRSAWDRRNGLFAPVSDFEWDSFDFKGRIIRAAISLDDVRAIFDGDKTLSRTQARDALIARTGRSRTRCYDAIKRFSTHLVEVGGSKVSLEGMLIACPSRPALSCGTTAGTLRCPVRPAPIGEQLGRSESEPKSFDADGRLQVCPYIPPR